MVTRKKGEPSENFRARKALSASWERKKSKTPGLDSATASEAMGWSASNFSHYLNGTSKIGLTALRKMCAYLDENPGDIFPELVEDLNLPGSLQRTAAKRRGDKPLSKIALDIAYSIDRLGNRSRKVDLKTFVDKYVEGYAAIDRVKKAKSSDALEVISGD